jgi:hypothetical protein
MSLESGRLKDYLMEWIVSELKEGMVVKVVALKTNKK